MLLALGVAAGALGLSSAQAQPAETPAPIDPAAPAPDEAAAPVSPEQAAAIEGGLQTLFATPEPQAGPDVFGFVPVAVAETPLDDTWRHASADAAASQDAAIEGMTERLKGLPLVWRARAVNVWVNHHVAYAEDIDVYGVKDHWAGLTETLAHGRGDCEDFALSKMQLLAAAGVPARDMYLILVRNVPRESDHAVLAVRDGESLIILDSNQDGLIAPGAASPYRPVLSFGVNGRWVFGHRDEVTTVAATAAATVVSAAADIPVPFSR